MNKLKYLMNNTIFITREGINTLLVSLGKVLITSYLDCIRKINTLNFEVI